MDPVELIEGRYYKAVFLKNPSASEGADPRDVAAPYEDGEPFEVLRFNGINGSNTTSYTESSYGSQYRQFVMEIVRAGPSRLTQTAVRRWFLIGLHDPVTGYPMRAESYNRSRCRIVGECDANGDPLTPKLPEAFGLILPTLPKS